MSIRLCLNHSKHTHTIPVEETVKRQVCVHDHLVSQHPLQILGFSGFQSLVSWASLFQIVFQYPRTPGPTDDDWSSLRWLDLSWPHLRESGVIAHWSQPCCLWNYWIGKITKCQLTCGPSKLKKIKHTLKKAKSQQMQILSLSVHQLGQNIPPSSHPVLINLRQWKTKVSSGRFTVWTHFSSSSILFRQEKSSRRGRTLSVSFSLTGWWLLYPALHQFTKTELTNKKSFLCTTQSCHPFPTFLHWVSRHHSVTLWWDLLPPRARVHVSLTLTQTPVSDPTSSAHERQSLSQPRNKRINHYDFNLRFYVKLSYQWSHETVSCKNKLSVQL